MLAKSMSNYCKFLIYMMLTEIHTAEPLMPKARIVEFEMLIEKLRRCKSPAIDQTPAELIKDGSKIIRPEFRNVIDYLYGGIV
jgi:hypothetical protein